MYNDSFLYKRIERTLLAPQDVEKALACCAQTDRDMCSKCPIYKEYADIIDLKDAETPQEGADCSLILARYALALVQYQRQQIADLSYQSEGMDELARSLSDIRMTKTNEPITTAKTLKVYIEEQIAQAVKRFAEELKERASDNCRLGGHCQEVVDCDDIDALLEKQRNN